MEPRVRNAIIYGVIVSWTVFPVFCAFIAMVVSAISGCTVSGGPQRPCIIFGVDVGRTLYVLSAMGWLGLVTLPSGGIAFALYTAFVVLQSRAARRREQLLSQRNSNGEDGPPVLRS
jgi:hypothetical protein